MSAFKHINLSAVEKGVERALRILYGNAIRFVEVESYNPDYNIYTVTIMAFVLDKIEYDVSRSGVAGEDIESVRVRVWEKFFEETIVRSHEFIQSLKG